MAIPSEAWPWLAFGGGLLGAVSIILSRTTKLVRDIKELGGEFSGVREFFAEYRNFLVKRRRLCRYLSQKVREVNSLEQWLEDRYSTVSASIESQGRTIFAGNEEMVARRAGSLARGLRRSKENLIVLEGEAGSGKSVTLRRLAMVGLDKAAKSRFPKVLIPLYINLKDLKRKPDAGPISHVDVREFVLQYLEAGMTAYERVFLRAQFDLGVKRGQWLFLFDSFDELPDVLTGYDYNENVTAYSKSLADFLTRPDSSCRGIIASRYFRGPKQNLWTRFKILPLGLRQQRRLIRRAALTPKLQKAVVGATRSEIGGTASVASNPMFLGLICEYTRQLGVVNFDLHDLFEAHVARQGELASQSGLDFQRARDAAQLFGFTMARCPRLGLSPSRTDLIREAVMEWAGEPFEMEEALNDLERIRLMRYDPSDSRAARATTFVHRRFQEYFAAAYLLAVDGPSPVRPFELLVNGQWREPTVTVLQTQPIHKNQEILDEATRILLDISASMPDPDSDVDLSLRMGVNSRPGFVVPGLAYHVIGIIEAGFAKDRRRLPVRLQKTTSLVLWQSAVFGQHRDRLSAVELAGVSTSDVREWLTREAFLSDSLRLRDAGFWVAAKLRRIPPDVARAITLTLVEVFAAGAAFKERHTLIAQAARLSPVKRWLRIVRLLIYVPFIDLLMYCALGTLVWINSRSNSYFQAIWGWSSPAVLAILIAVAIGLSVSGPGVIARALTPDRLGAAGTVAGLTARRSFSASIRRVTIFHLTHFALIITARIFWFILLATIPWMSLAAAAAATLYLGAWSPAIISQLRLGSSLRSVGIVFAPVVEVSRGIVKGIRALRRPWILLTAIALAAAVVAFEVALTGVAIVTARVSPWLTVGVFAFPALVGVAWLRRYVLEILHCRRILRLWKESLQLLENGEVSVDLLCKWLPRAPDAATAQGLLYALRKAPKVTLQAASFEFLANLGEYIDERRRLVEALPQQDSPSSGFGLLQFGVAKRARQALSQTVERQLKSELTNSQSRFAVWVTADWEKRAQVLKVFNAACLDEISYILDQAPRVGL